jgi:glycine cleavage system H protein
VTGEVVEANQALVQKPERLNEDPHGDAWLIKVRLRNGTDEINTLMSSADYQKYVGAE